MVELIVLTDLTGSVQTVVPILEYFQSVRSARESDLVVLIAMLLMIVSVEQLFRLPHPTLPHTLFNVSHANYPLIPPHYKLARNIWIMPFDLLSEFRSACFHHASFMHV